VGTHVPDLRDDRILLRVPTDDDVDAITAACQDPQIPRFTRVPSPYTRADALRYVADAVAGWEVGTSRALVMCDARTGALLGSIGLLAHEPFEVSEIGYWVAAEARRRGVASRAVRLLSTWALTNLGILRLQLVTHVDNVASQGVAERAGFTREGVLRSYATMGCGLADVVMFSMLPTDLA
jgi:RimJ/RimL family protein N-acetyltransferase